MCKEIISLHIGQAGVQSSHALWELICIEHGIGSDGIMKDSRDHFNDPGENVEAMYYEIKNSRFVPRAILMDLEPTVLDEVRTGCYRQLWNPSNLVNQKEDAASNYARGYYTSGKLFLTIATDRINREIERCDNLSAFEIVHSFAGGTGSGFSSLLSEKLSDSHGKVFKFSLGVFPSPRLSEIMVESYNTLLHTHTTLENEDCVVIFDNESLFNKALDKLKVSNPTFTLMNRLISQMFSSISLSHRYRFFGSQHADVTELLTNLVPYPRIHFPMMSYSPLVSYDQQNHDLFNCSRLTNDVFRDYNHVLQCSLLGNRFMSCCMLYRGSVSPKPIIDSLAKIKTNREIDFVEWCPTGFKIGINTCPPIQIPNCEQAVGDNALCMISGNTAIRQTWSGLVRKFDMLMSKRAFVHWYVCEGLEEGEFMDAREDVQSLILDYEELSSQNTVDISNETNNFNVYSTNNKAKTNLSNFNNSVLSNVTNRRLKNEIFENKHNQMFMSDEIVEIDEGESSPHLDRFNHRLITQTLLNRGKTLDKSRYLNFSNSVYSKPNDSETRNTNIVKHYNKCQKTILRSQQVIDDKKSTSFTTTKRNRHYTKDLEIKDIRSTLTKYLGTNPTILEAHTVKQKSIMIPLKRKPTSLESMLKITKSSRSPEPCHTDSNTSENNSSSKEGFLQKYEQMKNNNKDKSNVTSLTGSYQTAHDNAKRIIDNVMNQSIIKTNSTNHLLYRSTSKNIVNDLKTSSHSENSEVNQSTIRNAPDSNPSDCPNELIITTKKLVKDKNTVDSEISQANDKTLKISSYSIASQIDRETKIKNLGFSKIEIVFCEPSFFIEISPSIALT